MPVFYISSCWHVPGEPGYWPSLKSQEMDASWSEKGQKTAHLVVQRGTEKVEAAEGQVQVGLPSRRHCFFPCLNSTCTAVLPACMSVGASCARRTCEGLDRVSIRLQDSSSTCLSAAMWKLGTKPGSPGSSHCSQLLSHCSSSSINI